MNAHNRPLFPKVVVNGCEIIATDIAAEAQNHPVPSGKPGLAWHAAAQALVFRHLMLELADELSVQAEPAEVAPGKFESREEALIRQVMELQVQPDPISETEIVRAYQADKTRFFAPTLYEAAHILFAADPADGAARQKAKSRGIAGLETLATHPRKFADLAREQSDCSSRDSGGVLGQLSTGDTVPKFDAALASMSAGELSEDLVETKYGFHIIRLDAKAKGARLPLDAVRDRISEALEKAAWAAAASEFATSLMEKADISGLKTA